MLAAVAAQALRSWPERPRRLHGTEACALDFRRPPARSRSSLAPMIIALPVLFAAEVLNQRPDPHAALLYHGWYRPHPTAMGALPVHDRCQA